jgi:hypothetical protein
MDSNKQNYLQKLQNDDNDGDGDNMTNMEVSQNGSGLKPKFGNFL